MQVVRKNICLDSTVSHTTGILPYASFSGHNLATVGYSDENGNWGKFVSDIALVYNDKVSNEIFNFDRLTVLERLRCNTIINKYYRFQQALRDGTLAIGVTKIKTTINGVSGVVDSTTSCYVNQEDKTIENVVFLSTIFDPDTIDYNTKYDFEMIDTNACYMVSDGLYQCYSGTIQNGGLYVMVPDYEEISTYDEWWVSGSTSERPTAFSNSDWRQRLFGSAEVGPYQFCKDVEKYIIGKAIVPEKLNGGAKITGIRVPEYVYYVDILKYKDWFNDRYKQNMSDTERKEWDEHGGDAFRAFVNSIEPIWISSTSVESGQQMAYVMPYISFNLCMENEISQEGLCDNYLFSVSSGAVVEHYTPYTTSAMTDFYYVSISGKTVAELQEEGITVDTNVFSSLTPHFVDMSNSDVRVESKLGNVIDDEAVTIGGITGKWANASTGAKMYKYTLTNGEWVREAVTGRRRYICKDGESVEPYSGQHSGTIYRNIVAPTEYKGLLNGTEENGDYYFFLVAHDNGDTAAMTFDIPYTVNKYHNIASTGEENEYTADYVSEITYTDSSVTINYIIGGKLTRVGTNYQQVPNTGIHYTETMLYNGIQLMFAEVDGVLNVPVYYKDVDFKGNMETVIDEEYGLSRLARRAEITGMEVGSVWTSACTMIAHTITTEGIDGLMDEARKTVDISFNRGSAAAFEKYFKLSECNTLEDLENYGNNYFNL